MDRRSFLRFALRITGAASLVAIPACSRLLRRPISPARDGMSVFLGAREFELGPNRVPMALVAKNNQPIEAAQGTVRLDGAGTGIIEAQLVHRTYSVSPSISHEHPEFPAVFETPFFYDCILELPTKGFWRIQVEVSDSGRQYRGGAALEVRDRTSPGPQDRAAAVVTPTDADPRGVALVCSREPPCGMHSISLDESLRSGKPTILVIATPRFCTSRLCGPVVDEVMSVRESHGVETNFIHAEVFKDEEASEYARVMVDWNLDTEPWVFVIDSVGVIRHRFEGPITSAQIREALESI